MTRTPLLEDWKDNDFDKALLVSGARQIGKTFLIEDFARREFEDYVKVDFLRDDAASTALSSATDARQTVEALSLLTGKQVTPRRTLVFLDEVQEAKT